MDLGLKGKNVVITGGSKGIGLACARLFLAEGARVGIVSRAQANLDRAKATLGEVTAVAADLSDPAAALRMVDAMERALGPIDVLVNSAGAAKRTPPEDLTPAHWKAAMEAKYFSYVNVIDPVVKRMAKRGAGVIVNVIGNGGKVASPTHLAGGAANAALMLATAGLATAYAARGVRVVGLNPGATETERVAEGMQAEAKLAGISPEEARQRAIARIPLGRMATPEDIANAVAFLASDKAGYITGATVTMDGAHGAGGGLRRIPCWRRGWFLRLPIGAAGAVAVSISVRPLLDGQVNSRDAVRVASPRSWNARSRGCIRLPTRGVSHPDRKGP